MADNICPMCLRPLPKNVNPTVACRLPLELKREFYRICYEEGMSPQQVLSQLVKFAVEYKKKGVKVGSGSEAK